MRHRIPHHRLLHFTRATTVHQNLGQLLAVFLHRRSRRDQKWVEQRV